MNVLADTWRQLVRRRLWPVAVLLVAALAAVPVLLARDPAPVALPPDPVPAEAVKVGANMGEPIVAMAAAEDRDRRRRVLGARKDPFEPAPEPRVRDRAERETVEREPAAEAPAAEVQEPAAEASPEPAPAPAAPVAPAPTAPPVAEAPEPKKKTYPPNSLIVRFGDATTGTLARSVLEKLAALPADGGVTETEPLLVYLGLTKDRKSAIFMVDAAAEPTGDGRCNPDPLNCETIQLRKGETEFFDVKDEAGAVVAQYQLDVVDIKARRKPAKQARTSHARPARAAASTLGEVRVAGVAVQVGAGF